MLSTSDEPLSDTYDLAMLDLDGVVYVGPDAVPGAADHLATARGAGMGVAFITNNASRPPQTVATHLSDLGVPATVADVVTSAQAAAAVLVARFGQGARVALLGGAGLEDALAERGIQHGDILIADAAAAPTSGRVVIAMVHGDVLVCQLMRRHGQWWLHPSGAGKEPLLVVAEAEIWAVVAALVRTKV